MMIVRTMVPVLFTLCACSREAAPRPDGAGTNASRHPADSTAMAANVGTVRALTPGDRACYVRVERAPGKVDEEMAEFGVCERGDLVGKRVRLTYSVAHVPAASCEGAPDCARADTIRVIQRADPLP
jgi:hypothetical protein